MKYNKHHEHNKLEKRDKQDKREKRDKRKKREKKGKEENKGCGEMDKKYYKYCKSYKEKDTYWGLGIENELYLKFSKNVTASLDFVRNKHKRERYSVDYFENYKPSFVHKLFSSNSRLTKNKSFYTLPLLINSHTFTKTDINGNHKTTYTKNPERNPKFKGNTIIERLQEFDPYFSN